MTIRNDKNIILGEISHICIVKEDKTYSKLATREGLKKITKLNNNPQFFDIRLLNFICEMTI